MTERKEWSASLSSEENTHITCSMKEEREEEHQREEEEEEGKYKKKNNNAATTKNISLSAIGREATRTALELPRTNNILRG